MSLRVGVCLLVGVCLHGNINCDLVLFYTADAYMREIVESKQFQCKRDYEFVMYWLILVFQMSFVMKMPIVFG